MRPEKYLTELTQAELLDYVVKLESEVVHQKMHAYLFGFSTVVFGLVSLAFALRGAV